MASSPTDQPVREIDLLISQLLRHGLTLSDLSRDTPAVVSYREPLVSYDTGKSEPCLPGLR